MSGGSATVGASSGNEVVVRARGVYGRHLRLFEREGGYHLDLFKGIETVQVNGRDFFGGAIAPGDRITIGEATIIVVEAGSAPRPVPIEELHAVPVGDRRDLDTAAPAAAPASTAVPVLPATEVEYRGLRVAANRLCRSARSPEDLATELSDFLDRELSPSEWAIGEFSATAGFRPLASTFRENPMLPPRMVQDLRSGERLARVDTVMGILTLIVEPPCDAGCVGILVRESPRLPARAVLFLEELVQVAGIAFAGMGQERLADPVQRQTLEAPALAPAAMAESTPAENVLRQTDDLKKIVQTVEREVIDRAMRRVEGNQSRAAQVLNISRGSLIAKLKEFGIPDYRYLRRERGRRG
ncbi:MAG: helix-turn-helix domain-containing protein [Acidobacteriota bacterium]